MNSLIVFFFVVLLSSIVPIFLGFDLSHHPSRLPSLFTRHECFNVLTDASKTSLTQLFSPTHLFFPSTPGYSSLTQQYNPLYNNEAFPFAVLIVQDQTDVVKAVSWASQYQLCLSVKSSGHSSIGISVRNATLLLDLRALNQVTLNASLRYIDVGPAATNDILVTQLRSSGLMSIWGGCPSVAMGGYLQGGGEGTPARLLGYGVDNILQYTLVTSDAQVITASSSENPDLFWALRGGGSPGNNFGIITSFRIGLHEAPPTVYNFALTLTRSFPQLPCYPSDFTSFSTASAPVQQRLQDLSSYADLFFSVASTYPDEMGVGITWSKACSGSVPLVSVSLFGTYFGNASAGSSLISIFQTKFPDVQASIQPNITIWDATMLGYSTFPPPNYLVSKQRYMKGSPPPEFSQTQSYIVLYAPSNLSSVTMYLLGGVAGDVSPTDTAYVHRDCSYNYYLNGEYRDTRLAANITTWLDQAFQQTIPYLTDQSYQNWPDLTLDNWPRSYYGENLQQLLKVKSKWDPDCFFQFPQSLCSIL